MSWGAWPPVKCDGSQAAGCPRRAALTELRRPGVLPLRRGLLHALIDLRGVLDLHLELGALGLSAGARLRMPPGLA